MAGTATGPPVLQDVPSFPSPETRRTVRACLAEAGFDEARVCRALSVPVGTGPRALGPWVLGQRIGALDEPTRTLLHLFMAGRDDDDDSIRLGLGDEGVAAFRDSGLVEQVEGRWRATVQLSPMGDLAIASDLGERHRARQADFVLGTGGVTRRLSDFIMRDPVNAALDLGCGAGTLGALAASHARRVVATDVNPRAVAFSRFNAELNGLDHMECREGSLFEPVAGERFDLIVSNPPYVISPASTFVYRDGGTAICRALVRGAPEHLTDDGWLEMMAEWPERPGTDWRAEVLAWLDGVALDAWVLRLYTENAPSYAWRWVMQEQQEEHEQREVFDTWLAYLREHDIGAVGGGLVVLRPSRRSSPVRAFRDAPPLAGGPVGSSLRRWLTAQDVLAKASPDDALVDTLLVPSPEVARIETRRVAEGEEWGQPTTRLHLDGGLRFSARVDPVAVALVGLMGKDRTPRQAVGLFARRHGLSADSFLPGLPALLHRLLSLGILIPGDGEAPIH